MLATETTNPNCACHHVYGEHPAFVPTVEGLADAMRANYGNCTETVLQALGFPLGFIHTHRDAATRLANQAFLRAGSSSRTAIESPALVAARMRVAIGELLPSRQFIVTDLMGRGFSKAQIDTHLRGAIDHAGKDFSGIGLPPAMRPAIDQGQSQKEVA